MRRLGTRNGLAAGASAFTVALTATAFWLSYEHLAEVAAGNGLRGARAWAWPATIDLFIVVGELLILRASLIGQVDRWAVVLTGAGSGGSIALNVAGVGMHAEPLEYIVAAVPPVAALLAFGALMRQIHQVIAERDAQPVPAAVATVGRVDEQPQVVTHPVMELPATTPVWDDWTTTKVTTPEPTRRAYQLDSCEERYVPVDDAGPVPSKAAAVPAEQPRQMVTESMGLTPNDLRRKARTMHRQVVNSGGRGVTIDQLRESFGLSRREAACLRREVVTGRPS
ncbi:DUF2637 domain-containing protein [Streptomyces tirandamycinicus]|uniref:DUF2637 domain-containing protein n=1 Tax=Streptomyces tirandamycinicus TaxID=2174846 RepID=UPI00341EF1DD